MSNDLYMSAKAWPFEQARQILKRLDIEKKRGIERGDAPVVFETGYGPSGLPHIGTFGEVVRTTMVLNAFIALTEGKVPTKLICVSDDMDGMRKVPPTVPNPESLEEYLQKPLTDVPDPFGTHESYGAHMNARLRAFLDSFGFTYEFASATELYRSGRYDKWLLKALEKFDDIMAVMLPTLGEERRATYSPFLPISPTSGRVLYVPMKSVDAKAGTITFDDEDGSEVTLPVSRFIISPSRVRLRSSISMSSPKRWMSIFSIWRGGSAKMKRRGSRTPFGISIMAIRRALSRLCLLRFCSTSSARPMRLIRMCSGGSYSVMRQRRTRATILR